jgi:(6-4)DNA photolyase
MGDFKGGEWCDIWDGLYWRFVDKHRDYFNMNKRMKMMVKMFDKLDVERRTRILNLAEGFIKELTG